MSPTNSIKYSTVLNRCDQIISRIESIVLVLVLTTMILIAFLQVILRNFFSSGIFWGDIFLRHLVLWVGFVGASLATREKRHINIDALYRILPPAWQRWIQLFTHLFSAVICLLLARASFSFLQDEYSFGTALFLGIPLWLFLSFVLFGFVVMSFRFTLRAFNFSDNPQPASEEK